MEFNHEREVGIRAVLKASALCQRVFKSLVEDQTITKADTSPVTIADFGAQAVVNHLINEAFPGDKIVGEEDSNDLQNNSILRDKVTELANSVLESPPLTSKEILASIDLGNYKGGETGRFWTLDPIDGTKGFLRGEQFAVCLALIENGIVKVAIQGCPNLPLSLNEVNSERGALFVAVKGQGAFRRSLLDKFETKIQVCSSVPLSESKFCESVEAAHSSQSQSAEIAGLLGIKNAPVRMDSQCKYAVVAQGDASVYLRIPTRPDYEEKIWDHAGGSLLIEEAGGCISDITGKKLDFSLGRTLKANKGIIATSGNAMHSQVLQAVKQILKL